LTDATWLVRQPPPYDKAGGASRRPGSIRRCDGTGDESAPAAFAQRLNVHATLAKPAVVNRLRALRGPGESYSDVILQAAGLLVTGPRARRRGPAA
jgi:hypothetical protein